MFTVANQLCGRKGFASWYCGLSVFWLRNWDCHAMQSRGSGVDYRTEGSRKSFFTDELLD